MNDIINGALRELLKLVADNHRDKIGDANFWRALDALHALLTAQPQASDEQPKHGLCVFRFPDGYLSLSNELRATTVDGRPVTIGLDGVVRFDEQAQASAAQSASLVQMPDVDDLANFIRFTDGNHKMGAGALAERIVDWLSAPSAAQSAPAGAGHDGLPLVIAGAIFDFAGFLTTREGVIEVGATANASPVADLIQEWAELRGLSLADAAVLSWQDLLAAWQRAQSAPAGEREEPAAMPEILYGPATHVTWTPDHIPKEQRRQVVLVDAEQFAAWQRTQSARVPEAEDWSIFFGYLIDKYEGHEIAEERLQGWLSEMLRDPHYGALFRREKVNDGQPSAIALAIEAAEEEHGSLRAAAKALGIDPGYLSRLASGEKVNPSDKVLSALGLERVTIYRSAAPAQPAAQGQGEVQRLREALRKIMEAHRFNVSAMPTTEVHSICFDALAASTGQEVKHDA